MREFRFTYVICGRVYQGYVIGYDVNDAKQRLYKRYGHCTIICSEEMF